MLVRRSGDSDLLHEPIRRSFRSLAEFEGQDQFRMPFNSDEAPRITDIHIIACKGIFMTFLLLDEIPNFVQLNILHRNTADFAGQERFALLAGNDQELDDRFAVQATQALRTPDAVTFNQESKCELAALLFKVVFHPERLCVRFGKCLTAVVATVALQSIAMLSRLLAIDPAIVARHCAISLDRSSQKPDNRGVRFARLRLCGFAAPVTVPAVIGALLSTL